MKAAHRLHRAIENGDIAEVDGILKSEGKAAREACCCELGHNGNALHYAASCGHVDILAAILDTGIDIDACRTQDAVAGGGSALHEAIAGGRNEAARFLIRRGARIDLPDGDGHTPLHLACRENNVDIAVAILKAGGQMNVRDNRGATPLQTSILRGADDAALLLLRQGADVQITDAQGQSPLHYAAEWESAELVEMLLARGSNVNLQDNDGNTPLHVTNSDEVLELLMRDGGDPAIRNHKGKPAREERIDMEKEEFQKIDQALSRHTEKVERRMKDPAGIRIEPTLPSRIFSPGPPTPEAELKNARSSMLRELQKRVGYPGGNPKSPPHAEPAAPGQRGRISPTQARATPRATGAMVTSPLAQEEADCLRKQLTKTSISAAKSCKNSSDM